MSVETILAATLAATLKGSVVLAIVLVAGVAFRRAIPARWMHLLLVVGMIRLLMPVAPGAPVSLFNLAGDREPAAARVVIADATASSTPLNRVSPAAGAEPSPRNPLTLALLAIWIAGVTIVAMRTLRESLAAGRIARAATPVASDTPAAALLDECRAITGVSQRVRLAVTPGDAAPSMHGVVKPVLLLPATWQESLSFEQLRFVFLHELAHLRRLDVLVNWVAAAAHALHWFNPLVRIALARLAEERELACDALALEHLAPADRRAYGGTVLQLLDQWRLPAPVPGTVGMASTRQLMKRRIQMITAFRSDNRGAIWLALVSLLAVVTLTDARAGETQVTHLRMHGPDAALAGRFEQIIDIDLASASIEDVMHAISNRTGASITFAEGALDDATRNARLTLKAEKIPAHLVLLETLGAFDLAVRFTESGAEVMKAPEGHGPIRLRVVGDASDGDKVEQRIIVRKKKGDADDEEIFIRRHGATGAEAGSEIKAATEAHVTRKRIEVKAHAEDAGDGVTRRKVTYRGGEEGQAEGKLELEIRRANAS